MSFNPLQIAQLDYAIQQYTMALYQRAGGKVEYQFGGDVLIFLDNNQDLYNKCSKRATKKYTKQFKQGN